MIEIVIRKEISFVERVSIHYEPVKREYTKYAMPLNNRGGEISEHFGSSSFIVIWDKRIDDGVVFSQQILENLFLQMEKGKGIKLAAFLAEKGVNVFYVKKPFKSKGPGYVFLNAGIDVRITNKETLNDLMNNIEVTV
jgi:predicted Fe-Mo cluster-binding NifX family protein